MNKHKWIKAVLMLVFVAVLALTVVFRMSHGHSALYDDWWIVGKSKEQIQQRYGDFQRSEFGRLGYKMQGQSFYVIDFDKNDYAVSVWSAVD